MSSSAMTIGAAAKRAGCPVATVRYYEEIGLMPEAERRPGGHRLYDETDVARLIFIRRCRELDMPIGKIVALLAISDDGARPCAEALDLTHEHLAAVRSRLNELRELERTLAAFAAECAQTCCQGSSATCTLFSELREPARRGGAARPT
ncbi:MAG: MerR family transcriptional regulator [Hyphomonadaceae bacterium]